MSGPSLLDRIFAGRSRGCCDAKGGKGDKGGWDGKDDMKAAPAPVEEEAPMPPAPVVDASA
jgi:hypothetical protein